MRKEFFNKKRNAYEIYMINCGYEDCRPNFMCPPHKRTYYILHYVTKGTGFYEVNGNRFTVNEGDLFFIYPGETVSYYSPDAAHPWSFCWIGFSGSMAYKYFTDTGIKTKTYIMPLNDRGFLSNIQNCIDYTDANCDSISQYRLTGYLMNMLEILQNHCIKKKKVQQSSTLADRAVRYVEFNYMNSIKTKDIAAHLSVDRTYLYRIFQKYMHISPEQYLIQYRIGKAVELMEEKRYSVTEISNFVGIHDVYHFSKMFKKNTGLSPSAYQKQLELAGRM